MPSSTLDDDPGDNQHPPLNMYSYSAEDYTTTQSVRPKRRQVKNACVNCQKACKRCDSCRPCMRCLKYGISEECVDSQRKERKKGVKRGPYKKRGEDPNNKKRDGNREGGFSDPLHPRQSPSSSSASSSHRSDRADGSGTNLSDPSYGSHPGMPAYTSNQQLQHLPAQLYIPSPYTNAYYQHMPPPLNPAPLLYPHHLPAIHAHPDSRLPESYQNQSYYQPQMYSPPPPPSAPLQHPQYVPATHHHNFPALVGTMFHKHGPFTGQPQSAVMQHPHHHQVLHHG